MDEISFIEATWPAPANVVGLTTTRSGGVSTGPYASLNLGDHVSDRLEDVLENRRRLREQALRLDSEPFWLNRRTGVKSSESFPPLIVFRDLWTAV